MKNYFPRVLLSAAIAASLGLASMQTFAESKSSDAEKQRSESSSMPMDGQATPMADQTAPMDGEGDDNTAANQTMPVLENDTEVLGVLMAVNQQEIDLAKLAQEKGVTGEVLAFALQLQEHHEANDRAGQELGKTLPISAINSAAISQVQDMNELEFDRLDALEGSAFSSEFVNSTVQGHTHLLSVIDTTLMPAAKSDAVKAHLSSTAKSVSEHLTRAKQLATAN